MGLKVDLSLILKVIALICVICAIALNIDDHYADGGRWITSTNCFKYATGGYIIVLGIFIIWTFVKDPVEKFFAGILLAFGFIYNLGAGAAIISFYADYKSGMSTNFLVAGVMGLLAGVVMLIDTLHTFEVF